MKYLLLILSLPLSIFSQEKINQTFSKKGIAVSDEFGVTRLKKVIQINGAANEIHERIKEELSLMFLNQEEGIVYESEKDILKLVCVGSTENLIYDNVFSIKDAGYFSYVITAYSKDGKAKIVIDRIIHLGGEMAHMNNGSKFKDEFPAHWVEIAKRQSSKQYLDMKRQASDSLVQVFEDLEESLGFNRVEEDLKF